MRTPGCQHRDTQKKIQTSCVIAVKLHSSIKPEHLLHLLSVRGWFNVSFSYCIRLLNHRLSESKNKTICFINYTFLVHLFCLFLYRYYILPSVFLSSTFSSCPPVYPDLSVLDQQLSQDLSLPHPWVSEPNPEVLCSFLPSLPLSLVYVLSCSFLVNCFSFQLGGAFFVPPVFLYLFIIFCAHPGIYIFVLESGGCINQASKVCTLIWL